MNFLFDYKFDGKNYYFIENKLNAYEEIFILSEPITKEILIDLLLKKKEYLQRELDDINNKFQKISDLKTVAQSIISQIKQDV